MFYFLLIIYFFLFAFISWKKIQYSIFIILSAFPSYLVRFKIWGFPMSLLEGMILILFAAWFIKKSYKNSLFKDIRLLNYKTFIILFLLAASISVFVSPNKQAALGIWKAYFVEPILFLIVFIDIFKNYYLSEATYLYLASSLAVSAFYVSGVAIYQKFSGFMVPEAFWHSDYHRVTSIFGYPNAIGLFMAPLVMIFLGVALSKFYGSPKMELKNIDVENKNKLYNWLRIFNLVAGILGIIAIFFAQSEGALVGLAGGIFIFAFFYSRRSRVISIIVIALTLIISSAFYLKYGREWSNSFSNTPIFQLDEVCQKKFLKNKSACVIYEKLILADTSGRIRQEIWQESFNMIKDHFILGAGLSGYQPMMKNYHQKKYIEIYLYPHNFVLNFWSETGLLGLISFIWLIAMLYYFCFRYIAANDVRVAGRAEVLGLLSALTVLLIHGLVDVPFFKNDLAILFWLIVGMIIVKKVKPLTQ